MPNESLRWENNLRVATVVGLVGGGGLGLVLYNSVQLGFYPRVATLILLVYLQAASAREHPAQREACVEGTKSLPWTLIVFRLASIRETSSGGSGA